MIDRSTRTTCLFALSILLLNASWAFAGQSTLAITGATVHPVSGEAYEGTVVVESGLITQAGPAVTAPPGANLIDASGQHVYPGFFDAYSQLGLLEISAVTVTDDRAELGDFNPHLQATTAIHPASEVIPVARVNGITHAIVAPSSNRGGVIPGQAALVNLSGWTVEEMTTDPSIALVIQWPAVQTRSFDFSTFSWKDKALKEAEEEAQEGIDQLKDWLEAARHYQQAQVAGSSRLERDLKLEALARILDRGQRVVFKADNKRDIQAAIAFAEEQNLEMILAGARDGWKIAEELAGKQIPVLLGRTQGTPREQDDPYDRPYGNPGALEEAGVLFAFASSAGGGFGPGGVHSVRNLPYESGMAVGYGLSPEAALAGLTLNPAKIFGVEDRLGSVEKGKVANLIVTTGDPLEYTTQIEHVIVEGKQTSMKDKHRTLYERYRSRPGEAETAAMAGQKELSETELVAWARAIHDRVITLDTHNDFRGSNFTADKNYTMDLDTQVNLPKMDEGGLDVSFLIVYTSQGELNEEGYDQAYESAIGSFEAIERLVTEYAPEQIELALTAADVRRIHASGKKVAMIGIENGYPVGTDLSRIEEFAKRGARYMSLAHNGHSQLSDSNTGEEDDEWIHYGLSDLGKQAVLEMNKWGIMVDVSHPSKKAMMDMLAITQAPIIASHSAARALCDHSRNLDDEQLLALKENGGVVQAVAFGAYVNAEKTAARKKASDPIYKEFAAEMGIEWLTWAEARKLSAEKRKEHWGYVIKM